MENINRGIENGIKDKSVIKLFVVILLLTLVCIIFSPFWGKTFIVTAVLLFMLSLVFLPNAYNYCLLLGIFPFANIFKLAPDTMSLMTACEMLLLAKIIITAFLKSKTIKCNWGLLIGLPLTAVYMIAFSTEIAYEGVIKTVVRILLVAYYLRSETSRTGEMAVIKTMAYTFAASMLLSMILSQNEVYRDAVEDYLRTIRYGDGSSLIRNGGLMGDPNYCAMAIVAAMTFMSVLYYYKKVKLGYWLLVVPLYLLGFTTYSKSYFLIAVAFVIALLLLILFPKRKGLAVILCVVIAMAATAIYNGEIEIINKILLRFEAADITTGRAELNRVYISYIFSDLKVLLFGEGFNVERLPGINNIHNLYIEILFRLGLVGSTLFAGTVLSCFPKKQHKSKLVNYMPAMFTAVMYMALAGVDTYGLFYYLLLAGISVLHLRGDGNNENMLNV